MKNITKLISIILVWITQTTSTFSTTHVINVSDSIFMPSFLNATVGDTIFWQLASSMSHTTTSTSVPVGAATWDSPINSSTPTFNYIITVAGLYNYQCTPHGFMGQIDAQSCVTGISPNLAFRGQQVVTSLAGNLISFGTGIAPCLPTDVMLIHNLSGDTIYSTSVSIQGDSIYVGWIFSDTAKIGVYSLTTNLNYFDTAGCFGLYTTCTLPNAFGINAGKVSGTVYFDVDQNSVFTPGTDAGIPGQRILILPDSVVTFTNMSGSYEAILDTGSRTLRILPGINFTNNGPDSIVVNVSTTNSVNQDLRLDTIGFAYTGDLFISGRPRCNTPQVYTYSFNNNSIFPVNFLIKIYHPSNVGYVTSSIPPDSTNGDTLYFSLLNVPIGIATFNVTYNIPGAGTVIQFYTELEIRDTNNALQDIISRNFSQTVLCSFDPNDKAVVPEGEFGPHYTLFSEEMLYTIQFQNTGNDTAYDIRVLDTLDANLDWSTFTMIYSTHPVHTELDVHGIINFNFYHIMLPDSNTDEPGSHGHLSYAIRCKSGLPENTVVYNLANIYFDQNAPVVTNMTYNEMVSMIPVGIKESSEHHAIKIYPNPFSTSIRIDSEIKSGRIVITDVQGRVVYINTIHENFTTDIGYLNAGVYLYNVVNEKNESFYGRLIKQ